MVDENSRINAIGSVLLKLYSWRPCYLSMRRLLGYFLRPFLRFLNLCFFWRRIRGRRQRVRRAVRRLSDGLKQLLTCEDGEDAAVVRKLRDARAVVLSWMAAQVKARSEEKKKVELFQKLQGLFHPLTDEEKSEVHYALCSRRSGQILVSHSSNIEITGELLQCLRPRAWLNDDVINLYLELLKERQMRYPTRFLKCHFFNTFFYHKLTCGTTGYDYASVSRWTSYKKLGYTLVDCEMIFVPIHRGLHWCLAVIDLKNRTFQYLDSLGGTDENVLMLLACYLSDEAKDKKNIDLDTCSWPVASCEIPLQKNGFDCGMFMLKYVDFFSHGLPLLFSQEDMEYFRARTALEILRLRAE